MILSHELSAALLLISVTVLNLKIDRAIAIDYLVRLKRSTQRSSVAVGHYLAIESMQSWLVDFSRVRVV
jgi:hypothetical protein